MKKNRHTATQIVGMLREAEALLSTGKKIEEVCRHLGIAQSTYYRWREEYNGRLKQVVAEQALDISILREVARGNY